MPRSIDLMKKRERNILKTILHLSEKTRGFTKPPMILIGGYALRGFIRFARYTRDCDFVLPKKNGWNLDRLKDIRPKDFSIEKQEKHDTHGFMRWIKPIKYGKLKIRISLDFMEGEIRGRKPEEIVLVDGKLIERSRGILIPIANIGVKFRLPSYTDYFIMKVVSGRASDIRDVASLIHENGIPNRIKKRIEEMLPRPKIFKTKIQKRILPELRKNTFIDSWKGIFATTRYTEEDKKRVLEELEKFVHSF